MDTALDITVAALEATLPELGPWRARARAAATASSAANVEGGDPGVHADPVLLARHLGHYLAAAELAAGRGVDRLVDVGCGTGLFTGWLGDRLGASVEVVDHDPAVRAAAVATTGGVGHASLDAVDPAPLVTAMEVLEHVPPSEQPGFCRALLGAVAPGGLLVLSTPDESLYPGGWSGYAPHVGCVTAPRLVSLLAEVDAGPVTVLRLTGGPFDTGPLRRVAEAVGNRAWSRLRAVAPGVAARLEARGGASGPPSDELPERARTPVVVAPAEHGAGGSLVAVVEVSRAAASRS